MQLKEECNKVVLATNDVNLANKALINQIKTGNSEKVIDIINNKDEEEESFYDQNVDINSNYYVRSVGLTTSHHILYQIQIY